MSRSSSSPVRTGCVVLFVLLCLPVAGRAQGSDNSLFDQYNVKLEGSWVGLNTEVRLDSKSLGIGTALRFEDDLNLDANKVIPSLAFEWQVANRHRVGLRWQDISRNSSAQALTEIQWGDEIIPVDARVELAFDISQYALDWSYYPWLRERWAVGFGLGLRILEISSRLEWDVANTAVGGEEAASVTGPLPYVNLEYRSLLSDHWRLVASAGWLDVTIEDISGGQLVAKASVEYLLGERWAFGLAGNYSTIDVEAEDEEFLGTVDLDINDLSLFARLRF